MATLKMMDDYMNKNLKLIREDIEKKYGKYRRELHAHYMKAVQECILEGNDAKLC